MVKNLVRVLVRTARTWLHENEAQTETMPQVRAIPIADQVVRGDAAAKP